MNKPTWTNCLPELKWNEESGCSLYSSEQLLFFGGSFCWKLKKSFQVVMKPSHLLVVQQLEEKRSSTRRFHAPPLDFLWIWNICNVTVNFGDPLKEQELILRVEQQRPQHVHRAEEPATLLLLLWLDRFIFTISNCKPSFTRPKPVESGIVCEWNKEVIMMVWWQLMQLTCFLTCLILRSYYSILWSLCGATFPLCNIECSNSPSHFHLNSWNTFSLSTWVGFWQPLTLLTAECDSTWRDL